jgi:hypothetical protein
VTFSIRPNTPGGYVTARRGTTNLREISLFPMTQQVVGLLMGARSNCVSCKSG